MRKSLPYHPIANLFPLITGVEFKKLVADVRVNGVREPIWLHKGAIIDGRNRWRAAIAAGVRPKFREFKGKDLLSFVVSMNLRRRHLSESQRAIIATDIAKLKRGANQHSPIGLSSQKKVAKLFNIGVSTLKRARIVKERGSAELTKAVMKKRMSIFTASEIAALPKNQQRAAIEKFDPTVVIQIAKKHRQKRAEKRHKERIAKVIKLNGKKPKLDATQRYNVLLADPPFRFDFTPAKRYAPQSHYPTMTTEEICHLPVKRLSADDAILFLWAPSPKVEEAIQIMRRWDFEYKTAIVWVKQGAPGIGIYVRQCHELLLIGKRGNLPAPLPNQRPRSVIYAPRRGHSTKPVEVYEIIERMYPDLQRIELFARGKARKGWAAFGNEVEEQAAA